MPPPQGIQALLLYGLPWLLAMLIFLEAWHPWRFRADLGARWAAPVVLSTAFVIGYWTILGAPKFPPAQFHHPMDNTGGWLPWFALALDQLGLFDAILRPGRIVRLPLVAAAAGVSMWLLLSPLQATVAPALGQQLLLFAIPALTILIWWMALEPLAARSPGIAMPAAFLLTTIGVAGYLIASDSESLGYAALALAAALIAAIMVAPFCVHFSLDRGGALICCFLLPAILADGYVSEMKLTNPPLLPLILILAAPLLAWLGELPRVRKWRPWRQQAFRLTLVAIPILIAGYICGSRWYHQNKEFLNTQNPSYNSDEM